MTESEWNDKLKITIKDHKRVLELMAYYTWHSSQTQNVETDSLTGFLGMIKRWGE